MKVNRKAAIYTASVRDSFAFLKRTAAYDDLMAKSVPLGGDRGFLVPVCDLHADDEKIIGLFAKWREENAGGFPTRFKVTLDGTANWLKTQLLEVEDRLLFLVVDRHGYPVGHLGLANCLNERLEVEVDNVVRGVKGTEPGIMSEAMRTLLSWTEETLMPESIALRVLSDNSHAVAFYQSLMFVEDGHQPLRRHEESDRISFEPVAEGDEAPPDAFFLRFVYRPARTSDVAKMILTAGPSISAREASYALDAARYGWNNQWDKYIKRFEEAFAAYVGTKYALSTSSCTGALHLALLALGIGPGDEVIVPDITWVATANAVVYTGATPVFADIEPDSWCLDPASFQSLITDKTKAVMPVHLYGHPANMDEIVKIARRHGLFVVEDAAPAIGAEVNGRKTGTFGDCAAFSFQGAKLLVTGEGGMLVTDDDALYENVKSLWDQGRDYKRTFWINRTGWKYKMSNIQAAIGLGQLERVDQLIEAKRRIFSWYEEGLSGTPFVTLNHETEWARSIYWMSSLVLDESAGITRDVLREELKKANIDSRPVFPAISQYPIWPRAQDPQPIAKRIGDRAINLPSGVRLQPEEVERVCMVIKEVLSR